MARLQDDKISISLEVKSSKAQEEIHKLKKANEELKAQNKDYRKEITKLAATEGDHSKEIQRLSAEIAKNNKQIAANNREIREQSKSVALSHKTTAELRKEMKTLQRELANTSKSLNPQKWKETQARIQEYKKAIAESTEPTKSFLGKFIQFPSIAKIFEGSLLSIGTTLANYVISQFREMVNVITDFEKSNSKLASVLGTNIKGVAELTDQAKFLGRTTTATASDVTSLQVELAKLGFVKEDILNLTPSVLKFAKAVDTDLGSAAAFAGAAMRMFGKDSSAAEDVLATLAISTTSSALDFRKLESSLATVGPVANAFGFTIEDTVALLGELANAGFDASSAATATRNILLNMADSGGDLAKALGKPVKNIDDLVDGLKKLESEGIDLATTLELTDKRSVAQFSTFLKGADHIKELRTQVTDCAASFQDMSDTMAANAYASWMGFTSAVEGLVLKFFDFRVALKNIYEGATAFANWIGTFIDALTPIGSIITGIGKALGAVAVAISGAIKWFTDLFTQTKFGKAILNGLVAGMIAYKLAVLAASTAVKAYIKDVIAKALAMKAAALSAGGLSGAMTRLKAVMRGNWITLTIAAFVALGVVAYTLAKRNNEATGAALAQAEATKKMNEQYADQESKIKALTAVAQNENLALRERQKAINQLNSIIPGYNARIDATTGKYKASTEALNTYLSSLKKKLLFEATQEQYKELLKKQSTLALEKQKADKEAKDEEAYYNSQPKVQQMDNFNTGASGASISLSGIGFFDKTKKRREASKKEKELKNATQDVKDFEAWQKELLASGQIAPGIDSATPPPGIDKTKNALKGLNKEGAEAVSRLKEINEELKRLRKLDPESDEELDRTQKRIKLLQEEKRQLMGTAKDKTKRTPGTYAEDSLEKVLNPLDTANQKKLLEINKGTASEAEKTIAKNEQILKHCSDVKKALVNLEGATAKTHTKTLDAIKARQQDADEQIFEALKAIDEATAALDRDYYDNRIKAAQAFYDEQERIVAERTVKGEISQEAADLYLLKLERDTNAQRLAETQSYYDSLEDAYYLDADTYAKTREELEGKMQEINGKILTGTGKLVEKLREMAADTTSVDGIKATFDAQRTAMISTYDAAIKVAGEGTEQAAALEKEKLRRLAALNYQYQEQMWQLKELAGLSWADEYDRELASLDNYHTQGLLKEKDYQRKKLQLGVDAGKKYFDQLAGLSSSMFTAIQEAEIAASDNKFDVMIAQAQAAGQSTSSIEEEKERKKLDIQKKYADVNFAIKVSQIVADTAVAVMTAIAQLGPIAGPVAAALISATGIAQMISAQAERDKIKNLQPSGSSGSSSTPAGAVGTSTRQLTGYSEGGYTGDGGRYEVAGLVHKGEYVIPAPIMHNPRVVDAVGMIEAIRRNRVPSAATSSPRSNAPGFAEGGHTSEVTMKVDVSEFNDAVAQFREATKMIKAKVVYQDIERAGERLNRARAPFTRSKK